jgi:hypothetical protein
MADPAAAEPRTGQLLKVAAAVAGPLAIVACVLFLQRDAAFGGLITRAHVDPLSFFLPQDCFLGRSLAAGHMPVWNPHVMLGVPFASDPQSGWMSVLPMVLFSTMSCGRAIGWLIALLPIIGGFGTYAFLRSEGLGRPAATVGGLGLALAIAGSRLAISLPFSGALAWTAAMLWGGSRLMRASAWPARFVWMVVTALLWGQIAAAHLSHGLVIGTGALVAYLLGRSIHDLRNRKVRPGRLAAVVLGLGVALIAVNLAFLLPRLAYYPRTTLSVGYQGLVALDQASKHQEGQTLSPVWALKHATSPGMYVGAAVLLLSVGGFLSRRRRYLAIAMGGFALVCYLLTLKPVFRVFSPLFEHLPLGDMLYGHGPWRYGLGVALALPVLGAIGLEGWVERGSIRRLVAIVGLGAALWYGLPLLAGVEVARLALPVSMAIVVLAVLAAGRVRPALLAMVPVVLAADLVANGSIGLAMARSGEADPRVHSVGKPPLLSWVLRRPPDVVGERYTAARPFSTAIAGSGDRYATLGLYHPSISPTKDASLADQRATLLGLEDVNGYNPVQLLRYWRFVRAANAAADPSGLQRAKYNKSTFVTPTAATLDLIDVGWLVAPPGTQVPAGTTPAGEAGNWDLLRRPSPPRAVVMGGWTSVPSAEDALSTVTDPGFDPAVDLVVERSSGSPSGTPGEIGEARFAWTSDASARIEVDAPRTGILVIRNAFDPNWEATIDGVPAAVFPADYVLQGVEVPAGSHVVELRYVDPWIGRGIAGSLLAVGGFLTAAGVLEARRRRSATKDEGPGRATDTEGGDGASRVDPSTDPVASPAGPGPAVARRRDPEGAPPPVT